MSPLQRSIALDQIYVKGTLPTNERVGAPLRIMSWNIGRGYAPDRLARTINALRPDIACLQEVDWGNARTGGVDVLAELARATGMLGLYGVEFLELDASARGRRLAGGGAIGNALLTRLAPEDHCRIELPPSLDWEADPCRAAPRIRRCLRREPRVGRRFGLAAAFRVADTMVRVCSLHLEDKQGGVAGRWTQFMAAAEALPGPGPRLLAGDFNTFDSRLARLWRQDGSAAAMGKPAAVAEAEWWRSTLLPLAAYADPQTRATFAAGPLFRAKLDWIASADCRQLTGGTGPYASSDHRPVWSTVAIEQ